MLSWARVPGSASPELRSEQKSTRYRVAQSRLRCTFSKTRHRRRLRLVRKCELLDLDAPDVRPPPLDLSIRVIAELRPTPLAVRPQIRVPLCRERLALDHSRHRGAHRDVARVLLRPVGKVEDRLVQAGILLRIRRTRQPSWCLDQTSGGTTGVTNRRS